MRIRAQFSKFDHLMMKVYTALILLFALLRSWTNGLDDYDDKMYVFLLWRWLDEHYMLLAAKLRISVQFHLLTPLCYPPPPLPLPPTPSHSSLLPKKKVPCRRTSKWNSPSHFDDEFFSFSYDDDKHGQVP